MDFHFPIQATQQQTHSLTNPQPALQMSSRTTQRTFFKDLQQLYRTIEASTDGQAAIAGSDEMSVRVLLRPKSGCNAHAEFILDIKCPSSYPRDAPEVTFGSPIFHPNIDSLSGSICLSFFSEWESCYSLLDTVKAVLYLIEHPNFGSANNSLGYLENPEQLPSKTARLLAGLPVKEYRFAPNKAWCEWARANGCLPTREEEVDEPEEFEAEVKERAVAMEDKLSEVGPANNLKTVISAEDATLDDEGSSMDLCDKMSIATSDTIPSFAKIRYSIDVEDDSQIWNLYELKYIPCDIAFQRVLIWEPDSYKISHKNSVFYFAEILGGYHHRNELGLLYRTLFTGNVLKENQIHSDSRQTSSTCPWFPFFTNLCPSFCSYSPYSSSLELDKLFETDKPTDNTLTSDFCMWSARDGQGINDLFGRIFFEGERHRGNFTCFLDVDDGSDGESGGIGRLFDEGSSDHEDLTIEFEKPPDDTDKPKIEAHSEMSNNEADQVSDSEFSPMGDENSYSNEPADRRARSPSSASSVTYLENWQSSPSLRNCTHCGYEFNALKGLVNLDLSPQWKWVFRQTRWPIRFAPQQNVDLSMTGIPIPPWRVSVGRLLSDVCRFCAKNREMRNLVLLDPMALSPLSPLLNLMRHCVELRPCLSGVLWMTPMDALSPSYHVPIPVTTRQGGTEGDDRGRDNGAYPAAAHLRFLTITAFLTNWVAWLSRFEAYMVLGTSRFRPTLITAPVAAYILQPLSLGCGQAPLLDLWPLWLLRRLLTLCLRLPQLRLIPSLHSQNNLQFLFPFSELDEI